ncbi:hypothetical protein EFA46_015060 (plasmid) [Halarchaeum sp. CBA1220]|uniref:hypothetical protein n=1 Tax=Halarchaeum sp. CBA1220 TaxID=1853682 RepID=UPI000F3A857F|nr:hypothetical protein [Halarchaeum sp. CBA1220]QLC35549.1 hypothetical protein EFA46_015060 [Halarchaeum sp. CBA1220]
MGSFTDRMNEASDGNLRMVARLENVDFQLEYVRDDLEGKFSEDTLEEAYQTVMGNLVCSHDFTQIADGKGLESEVYILETKIVFIFPASRYEGYFVSFDRGDSVTVLGINNVAREFERIQTD